MFNKISILMLATATAALAHSAPALAGVAEIEDVLSGYVADYANDPTRFDTTFGIEVEGNWWTVSVDGDETRLTRGMPAEPTYYFTITEEETLHRINAGRLNMFTAMAKEFSTDVTPADLGMMEGYEPGADFMMTAVPQVFHFWTRGMPEIVPFSEAHALPTHGAHTVIIYYQPGFRSGWGYLAPASMPMPTRAAGQIRFLPCSSCWKAP